jgi:hypothetical protein
MGTSSSSMASKENTTSNNRINTTGSPRAVEVLAPCEPAFHNHNPTARCVLCSARIRVPRRNSINLRPLWLWRPSVQESGTPLTTPSIKSVTAKLVLSVSDAHDASSSLAGWGKFQNRIAVLCGLSMVCVSMQMLLHSFNVAVLKKQWHLTTFESGARRNTHCPPPPE